MLIRPNRRQLLSGVAALTAFAALDQAKAVTLITMTGAGAEGAVTSAGNFAASLYTGTGASQSIVNNLNLSANGGLVFIKDRTSGVQSPVWFDTVRGTTKYLQSSNQTAQVTDANSLTAFNANGFTVGSSVKSNTNGDSISAFAWMIKAGIFDSQSWTGDGTSSKAISHNLAQNVGMVIVKDYGAGSTDWYVWHRGLTSGDYIKLNLANAQSGTAANGIFGNGTTTVDPTSTTLTVGGTLNASAHTYVAYIFAHNPSGIIQCGSYTGASPATVNLGWQPQFVMLKNRSTASTNWYVVDSASNDGNAIFPNLTSQALAATITLTATGFTDATAVAAGDTGIYLAMRA